MGKERPARLGIGINGVKPHEPHETSHPFFIHPTTMIPEPVPHLLHSESGPARVLLINQSHQKIVVGIIPSGSVIKR
jgi:hypothetical protein